MGQSDPPSSINWLVVDDIIATALKRFDERLGKPASVGGKDYGVYANENSRFADNSLSGSHSADVIQRKENLVSACCIVLRLWLSREKIRRLVFNFLTNNRYIPHEPMIVHTVGWIPHSVEEQTT